ncbi:MAG: hypothetical protein ABIQ30_08370 [Devosia sp.]
MKLFGPLTRAVALGGALVFACALPAFAGPAEMAVLDAYSGTWNGKGTLKGAQTETVVCKMSLSKGNGTKLNYTGRCSLAGAQLSVTGTIAYVDANKRYEAVMNSGIGGFRGVAIGVKKGDGVVFDLKQRANDDSGNDVSIASTVTLSGGNKLAVKFHAQFVASGDTIDAQIPFTKG